MNSSHFENNVSTDLGLELVFSAFYNEWYSERVYKGALLLLRIFLTFRISASSLTIHMIIYAIRVAVTKKVGVCGKSLSKVRPKGHQRALESDHEWHKSEQSMSEKGAKSDQNWQRKNNGGRWSQFPINDQKT